MDSWRPRVKEDDGAIRDHWESKVILLSLDAHGCVPVWIVGNCYTEGALLIWIDKGVIQYVSHPDHLIKYQNVGQPNFMAGDSCGAGHDQYIGDRLIGIWVW